MAELQILTARAFGAEIEAIGFDPYHANTVISNLRLPTLVRCGFGKRNPPSGNRFDYWQIMKDLTVAPDPGMPGDASFEIGSPILRGDSGWSALGGSMIALEKSGARINQTCDFQIHMDLHDVWPDERLRLQVKKNLTALYMAFDPAIELWMVPREYRERYSRRLVQYFTDRDCSPDLKSAYGILSLMDEKTLEWFFTTNQKKPAILFRGGDYRSVEYRAHYGTLDPDSVLGWAAFCQGLTDLAVETASGQIDISCILSAASAEKDPEKLLIIALRAMNREHIMPHLQKTIEAARQASIRLSENTARLAGRSARHISGLSRRGR